jgi:predicted esterase
MARDGLHRGGRVAATGAQLPEARAAALLLHGRGATAQGILELAAELAAPGLAFLAPQAAGGTWYPLSFLAAIDANEPWLSSALATVGDLVSRVEAAGIPPARIALVGFSQGACLATEFVARNPRRYGALAAFVGGRIGPPGTRFEAVGTLSGTPALLAAGDPDPHVPWQRVADSAANLEALGATVTLRRHPGFPHAIHPDDLASARAWLRALVV